MPKRVPLGSIGVTRDKKTVYPEIGKPFDFTADELSEINALSKASGNELVRKLVNEEGSAGATAPSSSAAEGSGQVILADLTVPQLKDLAAARGVDLGDATKKDDIIAKLGAAAPAAEDDDL